jgi:hypothetical protein
MEVGILSLLAVVSAMGAPPSSDQKPAGNPAGIKACTLLTREVVDKVTGHQGLFPSHGQPLQIVRSLRRVCRRPRSTVVIAAVPAKVPVS